MFMFHILRVWDDNEDCSIVIVVIIVVVILKELEWQLVKDLVNQERERGRDRKKSDRDNYPAYIYVEKKDKW